MRPTSSNVSSRRGVAVVELVACLPIFLLLLMCSIDACNMIFLKQAMTASAYEAAREAVQRKGTASAARLLAENVLDARDIEGYSVVFTPLNVENAAPGATIRVTVSAPAATNSPVPVAFRRTTDIVSEVAMIKE